jgi:hypothetical protein
MSTTFDTKNWIKRIQTLYHDLISFTATMDDIIKSCPDDYLYVEKLIVKLEDIQKLDNRRIRLDITDLGQLFKGVSELEKFRMLIVDLGYVLFKETHVDQIKSTMSESYYDTVKKKIAVINKNICSIYDDGKTYIIDIASMLSSKELTSMPLDDVRRLYKNRYPLTTLLFLQLMYVYKKEGHDISLYIESIKDESIGYTGNPYTTKWHHPLQLMGLTFNMVTIPQKLDQRPQPQGIGVVIINSSMPFAKTTITYNINDMLFGRYASIHKKAGISKMHIQYSNTITTTPVDNSKVKPSIDFYSVDKHRNSQIYETQDGGQSYRMLKNKDGAIFSQHFTMNIIYGPKPRVLLYNQHMENILKKKEVGRIAGVPTKKDEYVDATADQLRQHDIDFTIKIVESIKKITTEERLYELVRANNISTQLKILARQKNRRDEKYIAENYLVAHLFQ